jgi:adenylate kinase family enzyme
MPNLGDVVLVTGPIGSGKSTLVHYMAQQLGWVSVSEDTYWVENGWASGLRTPEQEEVIQRQVIDHLLTICRSGRSVLLEFILYAEPPNPLSAYQQAFADNSVNCQAIVLKPSVPEILRRIAARGRPVDLQRLPERRHEVQHQVRVLESDAMRSYRVIDTTDLSVEKVYRTCLESLGRLPS